MAPDTSTLSRQVKAKPQETRDIQPHQTERHASPESMSEFSDVGWVDATLTLSGGEALPR